MIKLMNSNTRRTVLGLLLLTLCLFAHLSLAEQTYVLTAPPRESAEAGAKVYGPLAEFLTGVLGKPVVYEHPRNWPTYAHKMRHGEYDLMFDAPHFAAWRFDKQGAKPLVRLPGKISFVLVARVSDTKIQSTDDLIGKRVCMLPSPSLGALSAYALYPNPAQQPEFHSMRSWVEVAEAVASGECRAGVVRKNDFQHVISADVRNNIKVVGETPELTNQGITVSDRVSDGDRKKMLAALTGPQGLIAAKGLLERFSAGSQNLLPSQESDYEGQDLLRQNMMFGW